MGKPVIDTHRGDSVFRRDRAGKVLAYRGGAAGDAAGANSSNARTSGRGRGRGGWGMMETYNLLHGGGRLRGGKQRYGNCIELDEMRNDLSFIKHEIIDDPSSWAASVHHSKQIWIVDTNVLLRGITGFPQEAVSDAVADNAYIVTTRGVLGEVISRNVRERLAKLPFSVFVMQPGINATQRAKAFAAKSGDLATLSKVDLDLIALHLDTEIHRKGGAQHLRTTPSSIAPSSNMKSRYIPMEHNNNNLPMWGYSLQDEYEKKGYQYISTTHDGPHSAIIQGRLEKKAAFPNKNNNNNDDDDNDNNNNDKNSESHHHHQQQYQQQHENEDDREYDDDEQGRNNNEEDDTRGGGPAAAVAEDLLYSDNFDEIVSKMIDAKWGKHDDNDDDDHQHHHHHDHHHHHS